MQAVILCGGRGTRIRDVTQERVAKPMVPIGGKPILWHIMNLYAHYGVSDFILCLGYLGWSIKEFFIHYDLFHSDFTIHLGRRSTIEPHPPHPETDWRVTLAETGLEAMTGCRVKRIQRYIEGDTFCLTYGDGVGDIDIRALLDFHASHGRIGTITAVHPPGRFGELTVEDGIVRRFDEKPQTTEGLINGGFFVFDRRFFDYLTDDESCILEREPLMRLAEDGELAAYLHEGFWQPMDTYREYKLLNDLWERGEAPWKVWG